MCNLSDSLRERLTETEWAAHELSAAEVFRAKLKGIEESERNDFEKWVIENWSVKKDTSMSDFAPQGANWAFTIAGATIPLLVPPVAPLSAVILASLACGAAAKVLGDLSEQSFRKALESSNDSSDLFVQEFVDDLGNTPGVDKTVTGKLLGRGGLTDVMAEDCSMVITNSAGFSPQLEYDVPSNIIESHRYLTKGASLYFGELPWTMIVSDIYPITISRKKINNTFKFIRDRKNYDESVAGQATLSTFWLALRRNAFETDTNSIVKDLKTATDPVTLYDLECYPVQWDLEDTDIPSLIVWKPAFELDRSRARVHLEKRAGAESAKQHIDEFKSIIHNVWSGRSGEAARHHRFHPRLV